MARPGDNTTGSPTPATLTNTPAPPPAAPPTSPAPPAESYQGGSGPWSIFDYPNGDLLATAWAVNLLTAANLPVTQPNIQFVYNWEKSEGGGGKFNPLNQGPVPNDPSLTSTGQQYGGGAADFNSWQAGIAGAVDFLNMPNYAPVKAALQSSNYQQATQALWASPWAASHYGNGSAWNTSQPPPFDPAALQSLAQSAGMSGDIASQVQHLVTNPGQAGPGATTTTNDSTNTPNPQVPGINDIPALDAYIRQNFGTDAWLLDIPDVKSVLENAVANQESTAQIQAAIQQTQWWKTTSQAVKNYEQQSANNPADYSFTTPGSTASQTLAQVQSTAAQAGVNLDPTQAQSLAQSFMKFGWTTQQLDQAIGSLATSNASGQGNAEGIAQQLKSLAAQYYINPTAPTLNAWTQNIAAGTQTVQQFQAQMSQNAALKWTGYAPQLQSGYTMQQLTDSLRTEAAKTMEVDPNSIDFVNNPMYSKILDYVPPDSNNGVHRVMTLSEMDKYLKSSTPYGYTQNARDQAASLEQAITQTFGKVGQ